MATEQLPAEPSEEGLEWLATKCPDEKAACVGWGHRFPKPGPGPRPKGLQAVPLPEEGLGVVALEATCPDCGEVRILVTAPRGVVDLEANYSYIQPKIANWNPPKGANLRRRHYRSESAVRFIGG